MPLPMDDMKLMPWDDAGAACAGRPEDVPPTALLDVSMLVPTEPPPG